MKKVFFIFFLCTFHNISFSLEIGFAGDVIIHKFQKRIAKKFRIFKKKKNINNHGYDEFFKYIKPIVSKTDFAFANLETPVASGSLRGSSYMKRYAPLFNAPYSLLKALKKVGFNLLNFSNNHCFDRGLRGIVQTYKNIKREGMYPIGFRKNKRLFSYKRIYFRGKKIIFTGFAKAINCAEYVLPKSFYAKKQKILINYLTTRKQGKINQFFYYKRIAKKISEIRKNEKPDIFIISIHWGKEYQKSILKIDGKIAKTFLNSGADLIIGHHPHVLGQIKFYKTKDNRLGFMIYSLGNFISSMGLKYRYKTDSAKKGDVRDSIFLKIKFGNQFNRKLKHYLNKIKIRNVKTVINNIQIIPLWVAFHKKKKKLFISSIKDQMRRFPKKTKLLKKRRRRIRRLYPKIFLSN